MSDQGSKPNGADSPKRSLRDIAEEAYDSVLEQDAAAETAADEQPVDETGQPRDAQGRFLPRDQGREPGEADESQKLAPAPTETPPAEPKPSQPAPTGRSIEAPTHWPADDRAAFAKLPVEGQDFLLRRHEAMERDYTQKTQATAEAVGFVQTVAPIFQDQIVAESLRQAGVHPSEAIRQWAQFHRAIVDQNPQTRLAAVMEIARRAQIDPAALATSRPGASPPLSEEELKNPAIRYVADTFGKLQQEILANRQALQNVQNQWAARQTDEAQRVTEWQVNSFADEVDARGNKLRPHFDRVINEIMLLYRGDPEGFDMGQAYQRACYMNDAVRQELQQAGRQTADQHASNQRAALAAKGNLRGRTSPVAAPNGTGEKRSLRDTLEAAADEAGIN